MSPPGLMVLAIARGYPTSGAQEAREGATCWAPERWELPLERLEVRGRQSGAHDGTPSASQGPEHRLRPGICSRFTPVGAVVRIRKIECPGRRIWTLEPQNLGDVQVSLFKQVVSHIGIRFLAGGHHLSRQTAEGTRSALL